MSNTVDSTKEVWKTIEEFPDYSVSNLGRVRRDTHPIMTISSDGILKIQRNHNGYSMVRIKNAIVIKWKRVARLVAEAFVKNTSIKPQVNHKNGVRSDDRSENLEWVTCSENINHSFDSLGRIGARGELKPGHKLTSKDVFKIRKMITDGIGDTKISRMFGVNRNTIRLIRIGKNWKYL